MTDVSAVNMAYALPIILGSGVVSAVVAGLFMVIGKRMDHKAEAEKRKDAKVGKKEFEYEEFAEKITKLVEKMHIALTAILQDRIKYLCLRYIGEGEITGEELKDLLELHELYQTVLDGNGLLDTLIEQVKLLKIVKSKVSRHYLPAETPKPDRRTKPDEKPIILIVDDAKTWTTLIEQALGNRKYSIYTTNDPKEVKILLRQISPQLFILDYMMDDLTGLELIPIIRAFPEHRTTPIIMLSGDDTSDTLSKAHELGVAEFLPKNFKPSELREAVGHYI